MRWRILSWLSLGLVLLNCEKKGAEPVYSNVPFIDSPVLEFIERLEPANPDTLKLSFTFTDGDFDLGFDVDFETNRLLYFSKSTGLPTDPYTADDLITYKDRALLDSLPAYEHPYHCTNWSIDYLPGTATLDTLYYQVNPNHFNMYVRYYYLENDVWKEFNWLTDVIEFPHCGITFSGRFPPIIGAGRMLAGPFDIQSNGKNAGLIQYNMLSMGFKELFGRKKIKVSVQIQDRAFNKSNLIETPEIELL